AGLFQRLLDLTLLDLDEGAARRLRQRPRQIDLGPRAAVFFDRRRQRRTAERQVQVARVDRVAFGENRRALDAVLQLAHVPRPGIAHQVLFRGRRQHQRPLVQVAAEFVDEVPRQRRNVGRTIAQRRNDDRKHRQPEIQILAVLPRRHGGLQVPVRRRHHAHVDVQRRRAADALERLLLERAQDLRLQRQRQIADFIEEQRAAVRELELPRLALRRAGEGALLVAEELGLEQVLGNRRAVDRDKRPVVARAERVEGAREQLLAGAALALEEHRRVGGGGAVQRHRDLLQLRVVADDLRRAAALRQLLAQDQVFGGQPPLRQRPLDHQQQVLRIDRLREKVEGAFLHRRDGVLDAAERGHHDDRQLR